MIKPDHNAIVAICWRDAEGRAKTYVVDSVLNNPVYPSTIGTKQVKLPGGGVEGWETPWITARREVYEETGLLILTEEDPEPIHEVSIGGHKKLGYMVDRQNCVGNLRTVDIVEVDSVLKPPREVFLDEAINTIHWTERNTYQLDVLLAAKARLGSSLQLSLAVP